MQEAVFGTLRLQGRLDFLLDSQLDRGTSSISPELLRILRLGAYQLLYMGSVPDYAAVSESVNQARSLGGRRTAGLVNAVLRGLGRRGGGPERFPSFEERPVEHLSTWGSHPRWLVERWVARFGAERARGMVEAGNTIPALYLRPVDGDLEAAATTLASAGIAAEPGPPGSKTLRLAAGTDPLAALAAVRSVVQDPVASGVVEHARPAPGGWLTDLCAAPGGKGIALAGAGARVIFADVSADRLRRVREGILRLGLPERIVVSRGERPPFRPVGSVLADVPCTNTATFARHPDARWRLDPDDPANLAALQSRILAGAATVVAPGGTLVYATCTVEREENDDVVESFLSAHTEFELDTDGGDGRFQVLPGEWSTDGAFAVRLKRTSAREAESRGGSGEAG